MQTRELRDCCQRRRWAIANEYVDTGWSGAKASRPQLDRLMADARQGRFEAVLVSKLDRWGRSLINSLQSVQELASMGVRFIAVTQNIDTDESNPMSRFMLHIFGAFAEFERAMIRERTVSGVRAAKAKGKRLGRPRKMVDSAMVSNLRKSGQSWRGIAREMKLSVGTVFAAAQTHSELSKGSS